MFRKNVIYFVVILIGILLLADILFTNYNNKIIERGRSVRQQISVIKTYYDQVGKVVIHSLDIGLRGYAIKRDSGFSKPMYNARAWKDSIFIHVEKPLQEFGYDMSLLMTLRDSVESYTRYCFHLKELLDTNNDDEFMRLFATDAGAGLWYQYLLCEENIAGFTSMIDQQAVAEIEAAMSRNQALQIILFLICFPTLLYTAYYTGKTFNLYELLRKAEEEKNRMLVEQNIHLERNVMERTQEILAQNEEIVSQSEELATQRDALFLQNKEVQEAHKLIEMKNAEIQFKNEFLENEIRNRTMELQNTNHELIEHNNQLEQFAFIAAHNLRAPLARILGLANIISLSDREDDRNQALQKIVSSSRDLDAVVRDLNSILDIQKQTSNFTNVDLKTSLDRVVQMMEKEKEETDAVITYDIASTPALHAVSAYVESIFYNLISNALKYRDPERRPVISIESKVKDECIEIRVSDNGLGVDLQKYKDSMFNLYKRFHLHVEGKGLGLFLVKGQMVAMGGKIEVESEPGKGTTFILRFRQ